MTLPLSADPTVNGDVMTTQAPIMLLVTGLSVGGAERVTIDLARGLQQQRHRVLVVSLTNDRQLLDLIDVANLDIRFLAMQKTPAGFLRAAVELRHLIRREGIRLVHAHMPHAAILAAAVKLLCPGLKIIFTSHNFGGISSWQAAALRISRPIRHADILLAPGQHPRLNAARQVLIPNGVDLPVTIGTSSSLRSFRAADVARPRVLLWLGRMTEQKDPLALITALASLLKTGVVKARIVKPGLVEADVFKADLTSTEPGVRVELWMVGDGPLLEAARRTATDLGIGDRIRLLGVRPDVPALLREADVFVMSSRWEGLPLAVLEAGAAGVPVIAPPVGALPWLLADDCGFLCPVEAMATTVSDVLANPAEAERRAARFQRRIHERFRRQRVIRDHLALYASALSLAP